MIWFVYLRCLADLDHAVGTDYTDHTDRTDHLSEAWIVCFGSSSNRAYPVNSGRKGGTPGYSRTEIRLLSSSLFYFIVFNAPAVSSTDWVVDTQLNMPRFS